MGAGEGQARAPDLSVVISTRGAQAVADTVDSVLESGRAAGSSVEIVVVWAGAELPPALPEYVRLLHAFPAGLAYSRNRGLQASRGPVVAFVDDDEVVDRGWVGALLRAFTRAEAPAGVFGPIAPRDARGLPYCRYDAGGEFRVFRRGTAPWRIGSGGNMAFRRQALVRVGGFDPLFGIGSVGRSAEETEAIFRLLGAGYVLAWSPEAVVYHPSKTKAERLESRFPYAFGLGKLVRRHRDPALALRYGKEIGQALAAGARARDARRLRETRETLRGFALGIGRLAAVRSPAELVAWAPEAITAVLDGAPLESCEPSYRPDPHLLYRIGEDRLLHVYVNPTRRLRDGLAVRERAREVGQAGIATTFAIGEGVDSLWVLEEFLDGRPPRPADAARWLGPVAQWAIALGGRGVLVREGSWWADKAEAAIDAAPPGLRGHVAAALEVLGELPARLLHGDFQRKNVHLDDSGDIGVVDWEHAYDAGPPGLDVLFLAVMAHSDRPDCDVLHALAHGRDPAWAPVRELLRRAGIGPEELRPFLLATLAVWATDEAARGDSPGMPRAGLMYRRLLADLGPALASASRR